MGRRGKNEFHESARAGGEGSVTRTTEVKRQENNLKKSAWQGKVGDCRGGAEIRWGSAHL